MKRQKNFRVNSRADGRGPSEVLSKPHLATRLKSARGFSQPAGGGIAERRLASRNWNWFIGLLLVIATVFAYQPAWNGKPIWDDDAHLTKPELRSVDGLVRMWTKPGATQQYYPLVFSAFWVQHKLWGDSTLGYHLVNILLHVCSALLFHRILRRLEVPGAWLAAAIFALHPVHVESVAWMTELKNTLSGVLYLGAMLAYLRFDRTRSRGIYAVALGLFVLGLTAKTVIATLPAAILVVLWWKRGRLFWKQDVWPLVPFFSAGLAAGLFTIWVERKLFGAEGSEFDFSFIERCLIAGRSIWFHLGKLFWPTSLMFMYPRWTISHTVWWQYLYPVAAVLLLAGLWALRRNHRGPLAGLLFFIGTLFPALGFFNAYSFRYSFVNDHHQYLASLGIIAVVSAALAFQLGRWRLWQQRIGKMIGLLLLLTMASLTWRQCGMYADMETLWRTTIARNPDAWLAHNNLAVALAAQGRWNEAIPHYERGLQLNPDSAEAHNNFGVALAQQGKWTEAIPHHERALQLEPNYTDACYNLGSALAAQGKWHEAVPQFERALQLNPDHAGVHNNLGIALAQQGNWHAAIPHYERALQLNPDSAQTHNNLGLALVKQGKWDAAIPQFERALQLNPDYAQAGCSLAWLLATCSDARFRNPAEALRRALRARELTQSRVPEVLDTLAAAQAAGGDFVRAVATAKQALVLATAAAQPILAREIQSRLDLYEAGQPFCEPPPDGRRKQP